MMNFVLGAFYFDFLMQSTKLKVQSSKANNHGTKSQQSETPKGFRT
jgi:hypothetical protein